MTAYYVKTAATGGSDAANGLTVGTAWATILHASTVVAAGDVVHVQPGTYNGNIHITSGTGTALNPITYVSDVKWGAKIFGGSNDSSVMVGIWFGDTCSYNILQDFDVDGSFTGIDWTIGVDMAGTGATVQGCKIHDVLTQTTQYNAAVSSGNGGAGIDMSGGYYGNNLQHVLGNMVYNIGPPGVSGDSIVHAIYTDATGSAGVVSRVMGNAIWNTAGDAICAWHAAKWIDVAYNTMYACRGGAMDMGSGDSGANSTTGDHFNVFNNIAAWCFSGYYEIASSVHVGPNNIFTNNIAWQCNNSGFLNTFMVNSPAPTGTIVADPLFVSAANSLTDHAVPDLRLRGNSPGRNAGTTVVNPPTTDLAGRPRLRGLTPDRGCYEFQPRPFYGR